MRISDWSSDVCSSDLSRMVRHDDRMPRRLPQARIEAHTPQIVHHPLRGAHHLVLVDGIGADAADAQQVAEAADGTVEAAAEMVEYGREIAHRMAAMDWATVRWHARRFAGRWQPSSHRCWAVPRGEKDDDGPRRARSEEHKS